jgi:hypothetical protein
LASYNPNAHFDPYKVEHDRAAHEHGLERKLLRENSVRVNCKVTRNNFFEHKNKRKAPPVTLPKAWSADG